MLEKKDEYLIGVISDTHGTVRNTVATAFKDVDLILHAGDIDQPYVLSQLEQIAPVTAVRGNMDSESWSYLLSSEETIDIGEITVFLIHDRGRYHGSWGDKGCDLVVFGHTHNEHFEQFEGVYFLNPGCAGKQSGRPSVALLRIKGTDIEPQFVNL